MLDKTKRIFCFKFKLQKIFLFLQLSNLICGLIIGDSEEEGFEPRPIEGNDDLIDYVEYLLNRKSLENFEDTFQLRFPDKNESLPNTINSCGKIDVVVVVVGGGGGGGVIVDVVVVKALL